MENKTRVVNLRRERYDIYIGRAGRGEDGYFGSPIKLNSICPVCNNTHATRDETLPCYKEYLFQRVTQDSEFKERIKQLKGKTLGCFCKPLPCHGDIIVEYLESIDNAQNPELLDF